MTQLKSSKYFHSQKSKELPARFKLPNHPHMASVKLCGFHHHHPPPQIPGVGNTLKKFELVPSVEQIERGNIRTVLKSFPGSQLLEILGEAATLHPSILHTILSLIDQDPSRRKLLIRSLGPQTTSQSLRDFFSKYGSVEEAQVVYDGSTGHSTGFGFVTFENLESLLLALQEPSKKIQGFVSFTSLCVDSGPFSSNIDGSDPNREDKPKRKIRVENVPEEMSSETLLGFFGKYGEIEEGPWGLDMGTGKSRGFAYLSFKDEEGAKAALAEQSTTVDGFDLVCKMAVKEKDKSSSKIVFGGLGMSSALPMPLRIFVLRMFHYYYFHFRELATYNCYQN